jgi:class 3 adenylate cyclase
MARSSKLAVMFTDMKGYTMRSASSSQEELVALLRHHDELIVPVLEDHGGRVIKTIGDALMVAFPSPSQAVRAAYRVQKKLADWNEDLAEQDQIVIRIGIHAGKVTQVGEDLYGDVVNLASRIESITKPGDTYFSATVARAARKRGIPVVEIGRHQLKGIPKPVLLFKVRGRGVTGKLERMHSALRHSGAPEMVRWFWRSLTVFPLLPVSLVAATWLSPWLAAIAGLYLVAWLPWRGTRSALVRMGAAAIALLIAVLGPWGIDGLQARLDAASVRVQASKQPLPIPDTVGIWMLSFSQNGLHVLRQPGEHAVLQLATHLPREEVMERSSDFPMAVQPVRTHLRQLAARVRRSRHQRVTPPAVEIGPEYLEETPLSRLVVRAVAQRSTGSNWRIQITAEGKIGYAGKGTLPLGDGRLHVDRRVLAQLRRQGWLFSRACRWTWSTSVRKGEERRHERAIEPGTWPWSPGDSGCREEVMASAAGGRDSKDLGRLLAGFGSQAVRVAVVS